VSTVRFTLPEGFFSRPDLLHCYWFFMQPYVTALKVGVNERILDTILRSC